MLYPIELQAHRLCKNGRGGEIRTPDPLLPKQLRYQAALHPERPRILIVLDAVHNGLGKIFYTLFK